MKNTPQQSANMTAPASQPKSRKKTWIILAVLMALALLALGIVWFFVSARNDAAEDVNRVNNTVNYAENTTNTSNTANTATNISANTTNDTTTNTTATIPTTLTKVTLNNTSVYYPKSWGTLKVNTGTEDIVDDSAAWASTFKGQYLSILDGTFTYIGVNDLSSYLKSTNDITALMNYLKKVYADQAVKSSEFSALNTTLAPAQNAGMENGEPHYLYSSDKQWRGFWYLSNIVQEVDLQPYIVGMMYNASSQKVYTFERSLKSSGVAAKRDELSANSGNATAIVSDYLSSVYTKDAVVKSEVDSFLQAAELTGIN